MGAILSASFELESPDMKPLERTTPAIYGLLRFSLLLLLTGCSMVRLHQEISEAKGLGLVTGSVKTPGGGTENVIVALIRQADGGPVVEDVDRLSAVIRSYALILEAGVPYYILAFQDSDGDQTPGPGEASAIYGQVEPFVVEPEERLEDRAILLDRRADLPPDLVIDFGNPELASLDSIPIAAGEVTTLEDERFTAEQAKAGMWAPLSALREVGGGIYFLEPYDPERIPVLFVHGIGGGPQDFRFLIERLDRGRYQPWVYHYPSGIRLHRASRSLANLVGALRDQLGFEQLFLTAHSMGGLVARSSILQGAGAEGGSPVALFVTFSTPWNGHSGTAKAIKYAPAVVPSWIDMQPESDFLASLRAELPAGLPHHLFFGFDTRRNLLMPYSHDTVVSVGSQLQSWIQERAQRIYGFDLDHAGVLNDEEAALIFTRILDQAAN